MTNIEKTAKDYVVEHDIVNDLKNTRRRQIKQQTCEFEHEGDACYTIKELAKSDYCERCHRIASLSDVLQFHAKRERELLLKLTMLTQQP